MTLVLVASAMAALLPSDRGLDIDVALALVACHAVASRVRLYVGAGYAMPTQLVLVPMLFLLPASSVPLWVACGLVLAGLGRHAHPERMLSSVGDAWHAVGPSLVIVAAGEPAANLAALPVVAAAFAAQCATDAVTATAREWFGRGIPPAEIARVMGAVYMIDAALTPIGLWAAAASAHHRFGFLVVLPLIAVFAALAADRRARIEEAVGRLDELEAEHARLDRATRRIGEAFASKLDREALAELMLDTAVEAAGAERGRASLATRTVEVGDPSAPVHEDAERAARRDRALRLARADADVAMAYPLAGDEVLVVGPARRRVQRRGAGAARLPGAADGGRDGERRAPRPPALAGHRGRADRARQPPRASRMRCAAEVARLGRFGRPLALAMFDIDDFKAINDTHGHQQGDLVLREVAAVLRGACRVTDEAARYGGEELAVILPNTDLEGAHVVAEAIRRAVQALTVRLPDGTSLGVTVSAGVSIVEHPGDPADLIAAADAALYEAKRSGKNRTCRAAQRLQYGST